MYNCGPALMCLINKVFKTNYWTGGGGLNEWMEFLKQLHSVIWIQPQKLHKILCLIFSTCISYYDVILNQ